MITGPQFHWAPADRHQAIREQGLQPRQHPTVGTESAGYVSVGVDPATAWLVSGATEWVSDVDLWDLWQVRVDGSDHVSVCATCGPRLYEIRVLNPIPPERLWWVARRDERPTR